MIKEIIMLVIFILLVAASILNTIYIDKMTDDIALHIDEIVAAVNTEDFEEAAEKAESAIELWGDRKIYLHLVIRHSRHEAVETSLFELLAEINAEEKEKAVGAAEKSIFLMNNLALEEEIRLENVF